MGYCIDYYRQKQQINFLNCDGDDKWIDTCNYRYSDIASDTAGWSGSGDAPFGCNQVRRYFNWYDGEIIPKTDTYNNFIYNANPHYSGEPFRVDIGDCIKEIAKSTFRWDGQEFLKEVNISCNSVLEKIGNEAFEYCSSLTTINLPKTLKSIGESAFNGCTNLTDIYFCGTIEEWYEIEKGNDWKSQIPDTCIIHCSNGDVPLYSRCSYTYTTIDNTPLDKRSQYSAWWIETSYEDGVGVITYVETEGELRKLTDSWQEWRDYKLKTVVIDDCFYRIGDNAFASKFALESVVLPDSITEIGVGAFSSCSGLTSIELPNSLKKIEGVAFSNCTSLTSIEIPSSVTSMNDMFTFSECSNLTNIKIPSNLTDIGTYTFQGCTSLTSINLPSSLETIGEGLFARCSGFTSFNIPSSVTSIGNQAFYKCTSLTSLELPSGVTYIGSMAFTECTSLTNINLPSSLETIGERAFDWCTMLLNIYYDGTSEQFKAITKGYSWKGYYTYSQIPTECVVHCTNGDYPITEFD